MGRVSESMNDNDHASDPTYGLPTVLSIDEAAEFMRVNRKTLYDVVARGEGPPVRKIGRRIVIMRDVMLHWLASGEQKGRRSSSRSSR